MIWKVIQCVISKPAEFDSKQKNNFHLYLRKNHSSLYILYFLNPLLILETWGRGHFEGWILLFLALAIFAYFKAFYKSASIAYLAAIGAKIIPIIFFPLFVLQLFRDLKKKPFLNAIMLILFLSTIILGSFLLLGGLHSLVNFGAAYQWNGILTTPLNWLLSALSIEAITSNQISLILYTLFFTSIHIYLLAKKRPISLQYAYAILSGLLICLPTLHSWYLLWVLPIAVLLQKPFWIALSLIIFSNYYINHVYAQSGTWIDSNFIWWIEILFTLTVTVTIWLFKRKQSGLLSPS